MESQCLDAGADEAMALRFGGSLGGQVVGGSRALGK